MNQVGLFSRAIPEESFPDLPVSEVLEYRKYVDGQMLDVMGAAKESVFGKLKPVIELGLHHEQQHQELLLTDIKYNFSLDPCKPVYSSKERTPKGHGCPFYLV